MKALSLVQLALALALAHAGRAQNYDPLAANVAALPAPLDFTVPGGARDRDLPIRVYLPTNSAPAAVVLFSPGLGGNRAGNRFLGEHWAARGYVAVFLQHPGSDDSVWKDAPAGDFFTAMNQAASVQNFLLRVQDVPVVLDQLEIWNAKKNHPLAGRLNLKKIGMSGHSFGAVTTQAVSGESLPAGGQRFTDPRITAAVAFSPSSPRAGSAARAFGAVKIPWLLLTGTKDVAPIGNIGVKSRLAVYANLKGAPKYEVVLHNAEHSAFTDRALPGDREPRNPNHHRVMLAVTTAFWDAYLRDDPAALAWLNSEQPRAVMEAEDQWQFAAH